MKIYICGPITGIPNWNRPAFNEASERLITSGFAIPVNPHDICAYIVAYHRGPEELLWQKCMKADIAELLTCDGIALLPGWQNSKGANIERTLALQLGIQCLPIEEWYKILGV